MTQKRSGKHAQEEDPPKDDYHASEHDDEVVDEQGKESFPASDPPANY